MARKKTPRRSAAPAGNALMLAPMVIAMRLPLMWAEAATGSRPETDRAVDEKIAATLEGVAAMQRSLFDSAMQSWFALATGKSLQTVVKRAGTKALKASSAPAAKRVRANYNRLSGS